MFYMKKIKYQIFLIALLQNFQANAGEVNMFLDSRPSAEEMGEILFVNETGRSLTKKYRSISFGKVKSPAEMALTTQPSNTATGIGLPIKFAYDSAAILTNVRPYVDEIGKMLNIAEYSQERLFIEGHTDAVGSRNYNQILSEKRAHAVKEYLVANYQIAPERLFVIGKGESRPLPDRSQYDSANRRVQFYQAP